MLVDQGVMTGIYRVVRVDRNSGAHILISGGVVGSGPALDFPNSVAVQAGGDILVSDIDSTTLTSRLISVSPSTGARVIVSSNTVGTGPLLTISTRVRVVAGTVYLLDNGRVLTVNPTTGRRTLISGGGRGSGPAFSGPVSLTGDASGNPVVLDQYYGGTGALIRVKAVTGKRTVLSSNTAPAGGSLFANPYDVIRDSGSDTYFVLHPVPNGPVSPILQVDGTTGVRTTFLMYQGSATPSNYSILVRPEILTPPGAGGGGNGGNL